MSRSIQDPVQQEPMFHVEHGANRDDERTTDLDKTRVGGVEREAQPNSSFLMILLRALSAPNS